MGNNCSAYPKIKASGLSGIYDLKLLSKGILLNSSGEVSTQIINESILLFECKLLRNPNDFYANLHLGICLYKQGFYDIAETHLLKSLSTNETFSAYYVLGLIFAHKSKFEEAQCSLSQAIEINKDFIPAYLKLAEVCLKTDNLIKARKNLKQAKILDRFNSDVFILYGLYYKAKNKFKVSKKYFIRALNCGGEEGKSFYYLGEVNHLQGFYADALNCYQNAEIHNKGIFLGITKLSKALLYFEIEKFDCMMTVLKEALNYGLQVNTLLSLKGLSFYYSSPAIVTSIQKYIKQCYFDAIKLLKPIFRENRKNMLAGYFLGLCYKSMKNYKKSQHYFKKILKIENKPTTQLGLIITKKARFELEKKISDEVDFEDTVEYIDSPILPKIEIPEFVINFHNFSSQTEPTIKRSASFIHKRTDTIVSSEIRSVTPPKASIKQFAGSTNMNNEKCVIY